MVNVPLLLWLGSFVNAFAVQHPEARIVNGIPISANDYPWMVSLRGVSHVYQNSQNYIAEYSFCGGSLISVSPIAILTAAHCINKFEYNGNGKIVSSDGFVTTLFADINRTYVYDVVAGDTFTSLAITSLDMFVPHPRYNPMVSRENDIGLILFPNDKAMSKSLPQMTVLPQIPSQLGLNAACCTKDEEFITMGYGMQSTQGNATYSLEETTVAYMTQRKCYEAYLRYLEVTGARWFGWLTYFFDKQNETGICVVGDDSDICWGDSGGPLMRDDTQLIGVASGIMGDCNDGYPSIYTSTAHFHDWIWETVYAQSVKGAKNRANEVAMHFMTVVVFGCIFALVL